MSKSVIGRWKQKDTRRTHKEHFKRLGFELEFEGLVYSEYQNLLKEHTVVLKGGKTKFEEDEFTTALIARTLRKADGEEIDLTKKETLDEFGVSTVQQALDVMFTMGEINRIGSIVSDLSGINEKDEHKEIDELKN